MTFSRRARAVSFGQHTFDDIIISILTILGIYLGRYLSCVQLRLNLSKNCPALSGFGPTATTVKIALLCTVLCPRLL